MSKRHIKISPSILSADFGNLRGEIKKISNTDAEYIHFDVMDGNFVPNITFGKDVISSIRKDSNKIFDTHLMINDPQYYIDDFIQAGSDIITLHYESTTHIDRILSYLKSKNIRTGISIIPSTNENILEYILDKIDIILIMTVNPGFGGQKFISSQLQKINNIHKMIKKYNYHNIEIAVDGGIDNKISKKVIANGADILVSGSYIFNSDDYQYQINQLRKY